MSDGEELLFRAALDGAQVTVGHATPEEIEALAGTVGLTDGHMADDFLELWSLIAVRSKSEIDLHGLGWRRRIANTWITSPLVAISVTEAAIRTTSGKVYLLGRRDTRELEPELRAHLDYALRTWGYDDVRP